MNTPSKLPLPGRVIRLVVDGRRIDCTSDDYQRHVPGWAAYFEPPTEDEWKRIMQTPPERSA